MDAFTLRDLRHFFASVPIANGCDVVTVQQRAGSLLGVDHAERAQPPLAQGGGPHRGLRPQT